MHDNDDRARHRTDPPPSGFDPLTADQKELAGYGIPQRPDPQATPGLAALWDRQARRYRSYEHLPAEAPLAAETDQVDEAAPARAARLAPIEHCGYKLTSVGAPFTALFVTWTVPNLRFVPLPGNSLVRFRTFVGLGFLDVHVDMTVDANQSVSATLTALGVHSVGLPVEPGDVISGSLCLNTKPPGRANYVLANETRSQTVNFSFDSRFPPAVTIEAGISRGAIGVPQNPLAQFGVVYFDEISAYTTAGARSLTDGEAVTMVGQDGSTLARPFRLNDFGFKVVHAS
jgi:hypothetical protein